MRASFNSQFSRSLINRQDFNRTTIAFNKICTSGSSASATVDSCTKPQRGQNPTGRTTPKSSRFGGSLSVVKIWVGSDSPKCHMGQRIPIRNPCKAIYFYTVLTFGQSLCLNMVQVVTLIICYTHCLLLILTL